ncbi:FYVE, RhoGEF and PH domain-containing protein 6-like [Clytia hemisphaerica]|uniref:Uncharacterized protein n=1 Tax=Clytia hemisphaerica TaxID=252671 RepID=A0A7M5XDS7_9CNID
MDREEPQDEEKEPSAPPRRKSIKGKPVKRSIALIAEKDDTPIDIREEENTRPKTPLRPPKPSLPDKPVEATRPENQEEIVSKKDVPIDSKKAPLKPPPPKQKSDLSKSPSQKRAPIKPPPPAKSIQQIDNNKEIISKTKDSITSDITLKKPTTPEPEHKKAPRKPPQPNKLSHEDSALQSKQDTTELNKEKIIDEKQPEISQSPKVKKAPQKPPPPKQDQREPELPLPDKESELSNESKQTEISDSPKLEQKEVNEKSHKEPKTIPKKPPPPSQADKDLSKRTNSVSKKGPEKPRPPRIIKEGPSFPQLSEGKSTPQKPPPPKSPLRKTESTPEPSATKKERPPIPKSPSLKARKPIGENQSMSEEQNTLSPPKARPRPVPRPRKNDDKPAITPVPTPRRKESENNNDNKEQSSNNKMEQSSTIKDNSTKEDDVTKTGNEASTVDTLTLDPDTPVSIDTSSTVDKDSKTSDISSTIDTDETLSMEPKTSDSPHKTSGVKQKSRTPAPYENIEVQSPAKSPKKNVYVNVEVDGEQALIKEETGGDQIYDSPMSPSSKMSKTLPNPITKETITSNDVNLVEESLYDAPASSATKTLSSTTFDSSVKTLSYDQQQSLMEQEALYDAPPRSPTKPINMNRSDSQDSIDESTGDAIYDAPQFPIKSHGHTIKPHENTVDPHVNMTSPHRNTPKSNAPSPPLQEQPQEENIYAAPTNPVTVDSQDAGFDKDRVIDLQSKKKYRAPLPPSCPTATLSNIAQRPTPMNPNAPVVSYSMMRSEEEQGGDGEEETIYSNIEGQEEEESLYSAPLSTPVKKPPTPPWSDKSRTLSDLSLATSSGSARSSMASSRSSRGSSVMAYEDIPEYKVPGMKTEAGLDSTASTPSSFRDSKYVDMTMSSPPPPTKPPRPGSMTKRPDSGYETVAPPPQSPSRAEIQKRSLPPRPPVPKSALQQQQQPQIDDEKENIAVETMSHETALDSNFYQSVDSLRREGLQSEELSSDSDSESEDENTSNVAEDSKGFENKSKLFYIAYEILTTEKTFVEALALICDDFGVSLKGALEKNSRLLPENGYTLMFLNIESIYELDKKFLHDLEERMENWEMFKKIGDLVRGYCHFLKMYTTYIKGYDNAMAMYHDQINNNMKFSQLVKEFEKSKKAKNLKLTTYLLKPIQRIPSYRLLLKEYLKHLPDDNVDYNDIKESVAIVSDVANHINESMKEGEKFQEVLRIQSQIENRNDIIKPGRFLIKEGMLLKLSRKELQQRTFILFTDSLLYCAHLGHGQLKLILELPLAGMLVQFPDSQELSIEFSVISTKRSFLLNASSPKEREDWVAALQEAINVANKKIGTFTVNRNSDESGSFQSSISSDIGVIAPPWIPDSRVTMCQVCTTQFNVYNRRHHCRGCGKVVCKTCSSFEAPLTYMRNESARVCEKCYDVLLENIKSLDEETKGTLTAKFKNGKAKKKSKKRVENLPSTLTEINAQQEGIANSGFLRLKRGTKKEKRCWFVLKEHVLYLYKAASDPAAHTTIPVLGYQLDITGNWDEEDFGFQLSHAGVKESLVFHADNRSSAERWVHCFCKATALETT